MTKKNKKTKNKKVKKAAGLEKIPYKITSFYKKYKKQKEIDHLRKIKIHEREESKRLVQENKKLSLKEDNVKKEEERLRLIEEELKKKEIERISWKVFMKKITQKLVSIHL